MPGRRGTGESPARDRLLFSTERFGMANLESSASPKSNRRTRNTGLFRRIERHVQRKTINGLMELFPLLVTILVLGVIIGYADSFVHPLIKYLPWEVPWLGSLAFTGVGLIVLGLLFYLSGLAVSSRLGRRSFDATGKVLNNTPVVGTIYGLTQTVAGVMSSQTRFSRVVFIEWPREGMLAMGFVTGQAVWEDESGQRQLDHSMALVYVPTVPNPTSGNMAVVMEDDIIETDLTVEQAMRMVFSGGIVMPPELNFVHLIEGEKSRFVGQYMTIE